MQNENKAQHWKEKLADTEHLSSELQLNKSAAWEKLQQRLQQKPKRRKAIWYWVAAACLLPFVFFLSSALLQQNHAVSINITNKPATTKKEITEVKLAQKDMIVSTASISSPKKKAIVKKKINDDVSLVISKEEKSDVIIDSVVGNKTEIVTAAIDSTAKTLVVIQTKKKLKVVHINELGEPAEPSSDLAQNIHPHYSPIQIAREEVYGISTRKRSLTAAELSSSVFSEYNNAIVFYEKQQVVFVYSNMDSECVYPGCAIFK